MLTQMVCAGFGGQGILTTGILIANGAFNSGKRITWYPSYGSEMRGGTANCSVIISDEPVGAPIISYPDVLVAMNLPSLDKFEDKVKAGGTIFVDSSLIERKVTRDDVNVYYVPATKMAGEIEAPTLANMILMGKLLQVFGEYSEEEVRKALGKCVSARHADLLELNLKAMELGRDFQ